MHPAIFISAWTLLGALFALQDWMNLRRWGYHIGPAILFESWGMQFLVWGSLAWLLWRFLGSFIQRVRIPVMWAADYGDVGQSRSEATLVVFLT